METKENYQQDIEAIIAHQGDNGFKLWTTPDKKLLKGGPFTALESPLYLLDLGVSTSDPLMKEVVELIFSCWQKDGRFKISPTSGIYPCHVALAVKTLCYLEQSKDERLKTSLAYLIDLQEADGGWKCHKYSFGRGAETNYLTPHTTLLVLDCLRFFDFPGKAESTQKAVAFLLQHWTLKQPISPCHYGIGTLFMQVEYPFRGYNIFYYLYVLSFYQRATQDERFMEAYHFLAEKEVASEIIVERVVPKLGKLTFCKKGQPSRLATEKWQVLQQNIQKNQELDLSFK